MKPFRKVLRALRKGGSSINGDFAVRWWELHLECGHVEDRPLRFPPQDEENRWRRGFAALHHPRPADEAMPAPKRVRCRCCKEE